MDLSVIIPAYNVEREIKSMLLQLDAQKTQYTYEIIVVDDGSTDSTVSVISETAGGLVNTTVQLLEQSNKKQAEARNMGITHAQGRYVCFLDADDMVSNSYVQKMCDLIVSHNSFLAVCAITKRWEGFDKKDEIEQPNVFFDARELSKLELVEKYLNENNESDVGLWNKVFDLNVIQSHDLRFKNENFFEDMLFILEYILLIKSAQINTTSDHLYTLFKRRQHSTTTKYHTQMDTLTESFLDMARLIVLNQFGDNSNTRNIIDSLNVRLTIHRIHYHISTDSNWNVSQTKELVRSNIQFAQVFKYNLSRKYRISSLLLLFAPGMYVRMYQKRMGES